MNVLVVDHGHSTRCGIRDLGVRIAERLGAAHADCNSQQEYIDACYTHEATAVIVNYRADLMPWWHVSVFPALAILHQYGPTTVDAHARALLSAGFSGVLVLDPTVKPADPRVHAVGRPLPPAPSLFAGTPPDEPRIGSFGFAFPHKGFADVATEVATIPNATYALHIPEAYFNGVEGGDLYRPGILADIGNRMPDGGRLDVTWHDRDPGDLVDWLAGNTVNCLLYAPGQPDAGLSSALDYLIAAGRPMLVSSAEMFAAAQGRAAVWPDSRLADVLDNLPDWEAQAADLLDDTAGHFEHAMHAVLDAL